MSNLFRVSRRRKPKNPWLRKNPHATIQYYVADGRDAVGIIEISRNRFLAYGTDGLIIGKYRDLKTAVRALPRPEGAS